MRHEHGAAAMAAVSKADTDDRWNDISPYLDEALGRLSTPTRSAIALRFFEGLSFAEISKRLNISVDAAKQRVSRGLKQLRSSFAMHGVAVSDAALPTMLQANAVSHAPAGLAAKLAIAAHAAASPSHLAATKGVLILMAMSKAKSVATVAIILVLLGTATAVTYHAINVNTTKTIVIEKPSTGAPTVDTTNPASDITTPQAAGIVVGPDGKAIAGAQVNLLTQSRQFDIYGTEVDHSKPSATATTDPQGQFHFGSAPPTAGVLIMDDRGFAQANVRDLATNPRLVLQPWSRVEGILRVNGRIRPGGRVWLTRLMLPGVSFIQQAGYDANVNADNEGRFVIPRVVPGPVWVGPAIPSDTRLDRYEVLPGQTLHVELGHAGRSIVGHLSPGKWWDVNAFIVPLGAPKPAIWQFNPTDQGQFRIDDLPPGQYRLHVSKDIIEPGRSQQWGVQTGDLAITVPPLTDGPNETPLDVGLLEMRPGNQKTTQ